MSGSCRKHRLPREWISPPTFIFWHKHPSHHNSQTLIIFLIMHFLAEHAFLVTLFSLFVFFL